MNYRLALTEVAPERRLYLAVPIDIYENFFALKFVQTAIQHYQLQLIIYDAQQQVIIKWQTSTNTEFISNNY